MPISESVNGKVAVITGADGGVGSVLVRRFTEAGANVIAGVRKKGVSSGRSVVPVIGDVTEEEGVQLLFDTAEEKFGGVQIMINTVGGFLGQKPIQDVSLDDWSSMMVKNLQAAFLCTREAVRRMRGGNYGRIVNFSAMTALRPSAGRAPYAVSKAGISLLTEIVSLELAGTSITINALAPNIVDTEANRKSMPGADTKTWVTPDRIADLLFWLCSEEGSAIRGTTLRV